MLLVSPVSNTPRSGHAATTAGWGQEVILCARPRLWLPFILSVLSFYLLSFPLHPFFLSFSFLTILFLYFPPRLPFTLPNSWVEKERDPCLCPRSAFQEGRGHRLLCLEASWAPSSAWWAAFLITLSTEQGVKWVSRSCLLFYQQ